MAAHKVLNEKCFVCFIFSSKWFKLHSQLHLSIGGQGRLLVVFSSVLPLNPW